MNTADMISFSRTVQFALAAFVMLLAAPTPGKAQQVTVFAAASLKEAVDEIAQSFTQAQRTAVTTSYAGTSTLARQIEFGAPADVFIAANSDWMDRLDKNGHIQSATRYDLVGNALVLIGPATTAQPITLSPDTNLFEMLGNGRLAMALVDAVPAGIYGKEALQHLTLWSSVADRVAEADSVRAAMAFVALGAAPLGIVYATDAQADKRVSVVGLFPPDAYPDIRYPAALTSSAGNEKAQAFLDHLRSPAANDIFAKYGFVVLSE